MLDKYLNCSLQKTNPVLASHEFSDSVQDPKWTHRTIYDSFVHGGFCVYWQGWNNPILGSFKTNSEKKLFKFTGINQKSSAKTIGMIQVLLKPYSS